MPEQGWIWQIVNVVVSFAVVTGLIGLVLALATPFMPVEQSTATVNWPENGQVSDLEDIDAREMSTFPGRCAGSRAVRP